MVRDAPKKMKGLALQLDLAVFIVAVAILTLAGISYFSNYGVEAKVARCKSELSTLAVAVNQYVYEMHAAPTLADLAATNKKYNSVSYGPWIQSSTPKDPWGKAYVLTVFPGNKGFVVYSRGPKADGTVPTGTNITAANNNQLGVYVQKKSDGSYGTIAYYGRLGDL